MMSSFPVHKYIISLYIATHNDVLYNYNIDTIIIEVYVLCVKMSTGGCRKL